MSAIHVTTTTPNLTTETHHDAVAVVVIRPGGTASGLAVDTFSDELFALTLREIADRLDPPAPTTDAPHTRQAEGT